MKTALKGLLAGAIAGVFIAFCIIGVAAAISDLSLTDLVWAAQMKKRVNDLREEYGMNRLTLSAGLCRAAKVRATECMAAGGISHERPNGTRFDTVFLYPCGKGENLYYISRIDKADIVQNTFTAFSESAPHRKNMLLSVYQKIGFYAACDGAGRLYACMILSDGSPSDLA